MVFRAAPRQGLGMRAQEVQSVLIRAHGEPNGRDQFDVVRYGGLIQTSGQIHGLHGVARAS